MEPKKFKSERDTQIVIEKKFSIKKGDEIMVNYLKDKNEKITSADITVNGTLIGNFDLEELEDFLTIFLSEYI